MYCRKYQTKPMKRGCSYGYKMLKRISSSFWKGSPFFFIVNGAKTNGLYFSLVLSIILHILIWLVFLYQSNLKSIHSKEQVLKIRLLSSNVWSKSQKGKTSIAKPAPVLLDSRLYEKSSKNKISQPAQNTVQRMRPLNAEKNILTPRVLERGKEPNQDESKNFDRSKFLDFISGIPLPDEFLGQGLFPRGYKIEFSISEENCLEMPITLTQFKSDAAPLLYLDRVVEREFRKKLNQIDEKDLRTFLFSIRNKNQQKSSFQEKKSDYTVEVKIVFKEKDN